METPHNMSDLTTKIGKRARSWTLFNGCDPEFQLCLRPQSRYECTYSRRRFQMDVNCGFCSGSYFFDCMHIQLAKHLSRKNIDLTFGDRPVERQAIFEERTSGQ
jgi:hypothetical protein